MTHSKPPSPRLVPVPVRLPEALLGQLDARVSEMNKGRGWPHLTRSDLVRELLTRAMQTDPVTSPTP